MSSAEAAALSRDGAARDPGFVARPWPDPSPLLLAAHKWMTGTPIMSFEEQIEMYRAGNAGPRGAYVSEFGFTLPHRAVIAAMSEEPLLEIGAGCATWTRLVNENGGDAIATDLYRHGDSWERPWPHEWAPVQIADAEAAVARWPDRNVFCSYPSEGESWLGRAAMRMAPGRMLFLAVPSGPDWANAGARSEIERGFTLALEGQLMAWELGFDRFYGLLRKDTP